MDRIARLKRREAKIAVVGLGYVGLPLAVAFSEHVDVIGYDVNSSLIESYQNGTDPTREVGDKAVASSGIAFTADPAQLKEADCIVVAVPTPVHLDNSPDLTFLEEASRTIGRHMRLGALIVYESTVFPGTTEAVCQPILARCSGLTPGRDFFVGYSPERVNPGDRVNTLCTVIKPVAAGEPEALADLCGLYELICKAGVYPMNSIRAAEAAKLAENTQRDVNIAFMNEVAVLMDTLGIDTGQVIGAMATKWNALGFVPGLVGGHCIGVDPYYLIHGAEAAHLPVNLVRVAREVNEAMPAYVVKSLMNRLKKWGQAVLGARIAILGITFKENYPDIRGSKAAEMARMLSALGAEVTVVDPAANPTQVAYSFGFELSPFSSITGSDAVIVAVAHRDYRQMTPAQIAALCPGAVVMDVKGIIDGKEAARLGLDYWRL